jgi:hypothetical protein
MCGVGSCSPDTSRVRKTRLHFVPWLSGLFPDSDPGTHDQGKVKSFHDFLSGCNPDRYGEVRRESMTRFSIRIIHPMTPTHRMNSVHFAVGENESDIFFIWF